MQDNYSDIENASLNFQKILENEKKNEKEFSEQKDLDLSDYITDEDEFIHDSSPLEENRASTVVGESLNILANANFTIKCEVGEVNLSFKEIENLKIGDSIEFIKWPGKVKLRLNNLVFAEGYLVEMNDMLGVKITNRYAL